MFVGLENIEDRVVANFMFSLSDFEVILFCNIELKINCSLLLETNLSYRPRVKQKSKCYS